MSLSHSYCFATMGVSRKKREACDAKLEIVMQHVTTPSSRLLHMSRIEYASAGVGLEYRLV